MDFFTTKAYYRTAQFLSIAFFPLALAAMIVLKVEDRITVENVRIESRRQVILRSALKETLIKNIHIKTGAEVREGDPLIEFEDLQNWRTELAKKKNQLEFVREKAEVYVRLRAEGAQSGLSTKDMTTEANALQIEIEGLEERVGRLTLRAPFNGTVTELPVKEYESVGIGTPLLSLAAMNDKIIRCFVPEDRYQYLRKDQHVAIKSNQYSFFSFKIFEGKVASFHSFASHDGQDVRYETEILLVGEAQELLPVGSTATCDIIVEERPLYELFIGQKKR